MSYVFRSQFGLVSVSIRSRFSNGSLKTTSQPVVFGKPLVNLWFSLKTTCKQLPTSGLDIFFRERSKGQPPFRSVYFFKEGTTSWGAWNHRLRSMKIIGWGIWNHMSTCGFRETASQPVVFGEPLINLWLGFRVQGLGFRVQVSGVRFQGLGFRVYSNGRRSRSARRFIALSMIRFNSKMQGL